MKRDMDLVREILLAAERVPAAESAEDLVIEGHSDDEITEHVRMLADAGYVEATFFLGGGQSFLLQNMTWKGHDFLDAIRDQGVWAKTKAALTKTGGSATVDVVKAVATNILLRQLGLPPG